MDMHISGYLTYLQSSSHLAGTPLAVPIFLTKSCAPPPPPRVDFFASEMKTRKNLCGGGGGQKIPLLSQLT